LELDIHLKRRVPLEYGLIPHRRFVDEFAAALCHSGKLLPTSASPWPHQLTPFRFSPDSDATFRFGRGSRLGYFERPVANYRLQEMARSKIPLNVWAWAATVLADGRIATGTFGSTYAVFDLQTSSWDLQGVAAGAAINAVHNVSGRIYSVGDAGVVRVDGKPATQVGSLCNFLVSAGNRVFTGGQLGQLYDANTAEVLHEHVSPL